MFRPGDKFMAEKEGKHLECMCGMDEVPNCQEVIIGKYLRILNVIFTTYKQSKPQ